MYIPSDDSMLLLDCVKMYSGKNALEIGVGSCIIADALLRNFEFVAGTDLDIEAIKFCKSHGTRTQLVCCNAADAIKGMFDLIVSNPPYLPESLEQVSGTQRSYNRDLAADGGSSGVEITIRFLQSAYSIMSPVGKILFVVSSLANIESLYREIKLLGLQSRTIKEKRLFYETLSVIEISLKE